MSNKTEALKGLAELEEKVEANKPPSELLSEHQRVIEETKDLPADVTEQFYDQKTYDLFRYGLSLREAIESALANNHAKPDDLDFENAKEAIESSQNRGLFNQKAFEERLSLVSAAHGEDFNADAPIGNIDEVETADQFAAVLAGLFAAGNLPTTDGRRQIIAGVKPKEEFISKLSDIYYGLADMDETTKKLALIFVPTVGGLKDKAKELVAANGVDFFRDLDTIRGDLYFSSIIAEKSEKKISQAEAAVDAALEEVDTDDEQQPVTEPESDIVAEAADSARRLAIEKDTLDVENGDNLVSHEISITKEDEAVDIVPELPTKQEEASEDSEKVEQKSEQQLYEEALANALASPASLEALLRQGGEDAGSARLQQEVRRLSQAYIDVENAKLTERVWEETIEPVLKNIDRGEAEEMARTLSDAQNWLEQATKECDMLRRAVFDGYPEGINDALSRMQLRPQAILEGINSNQYFAGRKRFNDIAQKIARFDMQAMTEHEEVRQLTRNKTSPTSEDMVKIHELLMRSGGAQAEVNGVANRLMAEIPVGSSWQRKMDTIYQISTYARRIKLDNFEADIEGTKRVVIGSLDHLVNMARQGRYDGEAINTVTLQLQKMFEEFVGAGRFALMIQNLAAFA